MRITFTRSASAAVALIGAAFAATVISTGVLADDHDQIVPIAARKIFVPKGFDSNDDIEAVIDGYLPSTCYKLAEPRIEVDFATKTVNVQPQAYQGEPPCLRMLVPFTQTVHVGRMPAANYQIKQGELREALPVEQAHSQGQDDALYAPVERVTVQYGAPGQPESLLIEGRLTSSCVDWDNVDVHNHGDTIEILPMLTARDEVCEDGDFPFQKVIPLPVITENGRYLAHVRVMSGKAINVVFPRF